MSEATQTGQVINYNVTNAALAELKERHAGKVVTDKASLKVVTGAIGEVRTLRTSIEKKRKELKADSIAWGKRVDAEAIRLTEALLEIETPMKESKAEFGAQLAEGKRLEEEKERRRGETHQERIRNIIAMPGKAIMGGKGELKRQITTLESWHVDEDLCEEFTISTKEARESALNAMKDLLQGELEREAEAERQAQIREEQEAEQRRLDEQRQAQEEAERKLQEERDESQRQQDEVAEQKRQAELAEEKRLKDIVDEEARVAKEAADREAEEAAEVARREREEALRPDKEKLETFAKYLLAVSGPDLSENEALRIREEAKYGIKTVANLIIAKIEEL